MCKTAEATKEQTQRMSRSHLGKENAQKESLEEAWQPQVHHAQACRKEKKYDRARAQACGNCDQIHEPRQCPAYGRRCRKCGRLGHFARVCRQTGKYDVRRRVHAAEVELEPAPETTVTRYVDLDSTNIEYCMAAWNEKDGKKWLVDA